MKACVVLALFLVVALAAVAQCYEEKEEVPSILPIHQLLKRQISLPAPRVSGCQLWECNSNCIRRGYRGGYCAFTGCQCY